MPDLTSDQLKARLASVLSRDIGTLEPKWDSILDDALQGAIGAVASAMLAQGYTPAQVAQWDRLNEFQADIGVFWCVVRGGATDLVGSDALKNLDRRKELTDGVPLTINGTFIPVGTGNPAAGGVVGGQMDRTGWTLGGMPMGSNGEMYGERPLPGPRGNPGYGGRPLGGW